MCSEFFSSYRKELQVQNFGAFEVRSRRGIEPVELVNDIDLFGRIEVDDELLLESRWWNSNVGGDNKRLVKFLGWQNLDQRSRSKL